jgi:hypothetical protein
MSPASTYRKSSIINRKSKMKVPIVDSKLKICCRSALAAAAAAAL